jgi:hypothetical protein
MWANSSVPGWFVGFHDAGKVPADWIVKIDGIDFVLDQGQRSMELDGKTLDFVDNSYVVSDSAI